MATTDLLLPLDGGADAYPARADPERTALVPCRDRERLQVHTTEEWPAEWARRYLEGVAEVYAGAAGVIVEVLIAAAAEVLRQKRRDLARRGERHRPHGPRTSRRLPAK